MAKDSKDTPAGDAPKKGKKKLIILLLGALLLLGGGGAGGYYLFAPKQPEVPEPPEKGKVVQLEAVTINLADGHYLKLKIALQTTADTETVPDGSQALDIAIDMFSNRAVGELSSNEARQKAKAELKAKVVKAYKTKDAEPVMDVYLTEFVMQ